MSKVDYQAAVALREFAEAIESGKIDGRETYTPAALRHWAGQIDELQDGAITATVRKYKIVDDMIPQQLPSFWRSFDCGPYSEIKNTYDHCASQLEQAVENLPVLYSDQTFQMRVVPWMMWCFGPKIAADITERCDRFIEESLELVQSLGYDRSRVLRLVDYTYGRPQGEVNQEVGGVMVTLAALCSAVKVDMHAAAETELGRISQPEMVKKIRAKQKAKVEAIGASPLPEA